MSERRLTITVIFIFILLLFSHFLGFLNTPENLLRRVFSPVTKISYNLGLGVKDWYNQYLSHKNLFTENQQCLNQINKLYLERAEFILLKQENQSLRAQLNFLKKEKRFVLAEVIGKGVDKTSNSLIINRGEADGIKLGNPVVVEEGFLLGKVMKVEKNISIIQLITDNQSKIAASILNHEKTLGVVQGEHGISLKMTMIPQNETVNINDLVITSGLEIKIPRGLIIGKVESIQKELYEPFQSANLQPLTDLNKVAAAAVLLED